jgi:hypothetical protein
VIDEQKDLFSDTVVETGAVFSECGQYRYRLWRYWNRASPPLVMVMLNPSTATAETNDPTVERCQRRAKRLGFGGLEVVNIFAYRSTDPKGMKAVVDPVGPDNDQAILEVCQKAMGLPGDAMAPPGMVIVAWGQHGNHRGRGKQVIKMLRSHKIVINFLTLTKDNQPGHPLYVDYSVTPKHYWVDDLDCSRCFHKACCVCFSVTVTDKERGRFKTNGIYLERTGVGQCVYFSIEEGRCTVYGERPEECRNWSCKQDPRWPVIVDAYISGKDRVTWAIPAPEVDPTGIIARKLEEVTE